MVDFSYSENKCLAFGENFWDIRNDGNCYQWNGLVQTELLVNSPDNPSEEKRVFENNTKVQLDTHILRRSQIGTLAAFIRFQADYDPDIFPDLVEGHVSQDFAVGLESIKFSFHRQDWAVSVGYLENAAKRYVEEGYTDRGSQNLDGRSGLGIGFAGIIAGTNVNVTFQETSSTTRGKTRRPNIGFGIARTFGSFKAALGGTLLNVDDFDAVSNLPLFVENRALFEPPKQPKLGFAVGAEASFAFQNGSAYADVTYASGASEDTLFAFSDGLDVLSLSAGVRYEVVPDLFFNLDAAYIAALETGFRNKNGVVAVANLEWMPLEDWTFLGEIGFSSIERFGNNGERFFDIGAADAPDFLLQIRRDFLILPY